MAFGPLFPSWSGRLLVSDFSFANGESSLAIDAPRSDLVLQLHSGPAIVGRILDPAGHPLASLEGVFELRIGSTRELSEETDRWPFVCRADGRFRIPSKNRGDWCVLTLRAEAEGLGHLHLATPAFLPANGRDLGDLELERVRTLAFTVRDPRGAPIENAFARVDDLAWSRRSASTGPDGNGSLGFAPERAVDVCVSAPGYADRVLKVDSERLLDVVLQPLSVLEISLVGSLSAQAEKLVLSAECSAFVWDESDWDERADHQFELGSIKPTVRRRPATSAQRFEYEFQRQYDGRFHLVGLVPDVPLTIEVRDDQGRSLAADTVSVGSEASAKLELGDPSTPGIEPARTKMPMRRSTASPR